MREVVVTGLGAVSPLGVGARMLHERWCAGASGVRDGAAACSDFDPRDHLSAKDARRADRFSQLAMVAADEALRQAGWDGRPPCDPTRVGCVVGTGIGGLATVERAHRALTERGPQSVPALSVPLMMGNAAGAAVAMRHGLCGPSFGVISACASGAHAVGMAVRTIQHADADAVVTGAAEAALTPLARAAFGALEAVSPSGVVRPFDARRDGLVIGEGAGILVLEDAELAARRGAPVLGRIRGFGATSDAFHLTAPDPEGGGAARAISRALQDAAARPQDVVYVNAHGTSTPLNDRAETLAIKKALGEHARRVPVSSTKSAIGHLLGAAGAIEAVATILALQDRVAPPTLGWEMREDGLDLDYVPGTARPLAIGDAPAVALSNSFGFGGHNAVLCLEAA
jgi:3-oxoacyl-[acyl-carrier-protein] synthase II